MANSTSLTEGERFATQSRYIFASFPEVTTVVSQAGAPDDGTDTGGFGNTEYFVDLKPKDQWRPVFHQDKDELIAAMNRELQKYPGAFWNFSQPIEDNVDETLTGTKGGLAAKLYGPDLDVLEQKGEEIKNVMAQIPGIKDLGLQRDTGQPNLDLTVDRKAAARFGLNVADVQDAIQTAVGGFPIGQILQGEAVYNLTARYQKSYRDTKEAIQDIRLLSPSGERVSLAQVTNVQVKDGAYDIYREKNSRYVAIRFEVRDRDLGSTVQEAIAKINQNVQLPRGYHLEWAGEYESEKRAEARLLIIVPLTILIIFIILYTMFKLGEVGAADPDQRSHGPGRRVGGSAGYGYTFQCVFGGGLPGAIWCLGANRRHYAGIHQPAACPRLHHYRCCHRRRCTQASPHHDDHASGDIRAVASGFLTCHWFRFAAALRHRHRRRTYFRPGDEHCSAAHTLCVVCQRAG